MQRLNAFFSIATELVVSVTCTTLESIILPVYQWARVPAFERGNVATVVLVQNVQNFSPSKAFVS